MSDRITVNAQMSIKESPELEKVQHKAIAGLTDEEIIKRNTIGELTEPGKSSGDKKGNNI